MITSIIPALKEAEAKISPPVLDKYIVRSYLKGERGQGGWGRREGREGKRENGSLLHLPAQMLFPLLFNPLCRSDFSICLKHFL